jgi:hypothetical protein
MSLPASRRAYYRPGFGNTVLRGKCVWPDKIFSRLEYNRRLADSVPDSRYISEDKRNIICDWRVRRLRAWKCHHQKR